HGQPGTVRHAVCDDEATLVYLANQASLELHVPLSRLPELENPDRLVIDLDPPDDVRIGVLREVARAARKLFETVGLVPFVQTTVAPYSPRARAGAPAATPLDWSELSRVTPDAYGLSNPGHRLARKADPWADFDKHARSAAEASQRLAELD